MMNRPEDKDPLDALLREQNPHIDDNGFTARVLTALPTRRRAWLRPTILLGATAIGSALASRWLPWENLAPPDLSAVLSLNFQVLLPWLLVLSVMASLACAVIAAMQWED
jgi:hypothetical protein